ncbi:MAG: hypothetical protein IJD14_04810 [Christensenellaceae bacterium]|nr:hypothetical protein [Christensenellaceae bacterium]
MTMGVHGELEYIKERYEQSRMDMEAIFTDVEKIRRLFYEKGAEKIERTDAALRDLCKKYCANAGENCFIKSGCGTCSNFKWRGAGRSK